MLHQLQGDKRIRLKSDGGAADPKGLTHPGQSKVHLHLRHPLSHAGPNADAERDEAVRVVLEGARRRLLRTQPALRDKALGVDKLGLVVAHGVVAQVEESLEGQSGTRSSDS